ncbi:MAG: ABC transporter, permease protein 2 (cluster 5, nickel/peptides/opines) [uncultured Thermomicrobiales bacterium]|uniref:ABC transporter, permease protein 2 (Cluster 5, nickel/peptides/opines) n=1 Tax=uncultured Thermomicrobiales bacterium TaxID=1645740 RepID=A0A6J4UXU7_9BACT|nr:MAG: ABC transporter, permease protein 2 (cluster 5, nickel/peptides/opines) [uncultured Thermomicrobiales bacterium]
MAVEWIAVDWRGAMAERGKAARPRQPGRARPARRPPVGPLVGLCIIALLVVVAVFGPALTAAEPDRQDLVSRLRPPLGFGGDAAHPLGTDPLGRDLLARVVVGARVSLVLAAAVTLVAGTAGVALGLVAGLAGGVGARVVGWLTDVQMALPFVVVAIAVTAALGPGLGPVVLTLALTGWVGYARIVRLQTLALRRAPWLEAARSLGVGPGRLTLRHVLPNLVGPIAVVAGQQAGATILYEAALSYLGLGLGGEVVTWGGMIAAGGETLATAWWVSTVPGVALALTILGLNLVGDWLATRGRSP